MQSFYIINEYICRADISTFIVETKLQRPYWKMGNRLSYLNGFRPCGFASLSFDKFAKY